MSNQAVNANVVVSLAELAKKPLRMTVNYVRDCLAARRLHRLTTERAKTDGPVRVAFLLQCPEVWDKSEGVYEFMWRDSRFAPVLIALPDVSVSSWDESPIGEFKRGSEELCAIRYRDRDVIFAVSEDGSIEDLSKLGFEYVFYQRPYDAKLPKEYRSEVVASWSRVCHIPYGFILAKVFEKMVFTENRRFFRNAYFAFLDSDHMRDLMEKTWSKRPGAQFRHFESLGYPALEEFALLTSSEGPIRRVLWTPRWSSDAKVGGSHFMDYRYDILTLPEKGLSARVRPHQLMWGELERTGIMSAEEVRRYHTQLEDSNCELSDGGDCAEDFKWSDVLVTDFSSMIIQYYLSGKPIIYCPPDYKMNELMETLMEGMYVAEGWDDVDRWLMLLKQGKDPKRELRQRIIAEHLGDVAGSAEAISERVYEDFSKRLMA